MRVTYFAGQEGQYLQFVFYGGWNMGTGKPNDIHGMETTVIFPAKKFGASPSAEKLRGSVFFGSKRGVCCF